jgi:hypothetical protein
LAEGEDEMEGPESKSVKVNCSFCGKEMECPEDMLAKSKKHMCFDCFNEKDIPDEELKDVHIDAPVNALAARISSEMTNDIVDELFPELWRNKKGELKQMSKKELAEEMFGTGVYYGIRALMAAVVRRSEQGGKPVENANETSED